MSEEEDNVDQPDKKSGHNLKGGIIAVHLVDKEALYRAYMPYIKGGAIFAPTNDEYQIGDEVIILLKLMDEMEKFPIAGKVVWITPACAQGGLQAGVGVQILDDKDKGVVAKIETYLAGMSQDNSTNTM